MLLPMEETRPQSPSPLPTPGTRRSKRLTSWCAFLRLLQNMCSLPLYIGGGKGRLVDGAVAHVGGMHVWRHAAWSTKPCRRELEREGEFYAELSAFACGLLVHPQSDGCAFFLSPRLPHFGVECNMTTVKRCSSGLTTHRGRLAGGRQGSG